MKKLLLSLMVLATLASCGKNNKVSSSVDPAAPNLGITNPLVTGSPLISMINNPASFGQGQIVSSNTNQTCGTKWGIFNYCYSSSSGSTQTSQTWAQLIASNPNITYYFYNSTVGTRSFTNSSVAVAAKQAELASLLNAATSVEVNGPIFSITTASAKYVIDTRYPIQLNPSGTATQNLIEYFVEAR